MPGTPEYRFVRTDKLYVVVNGGPEALSQADIHKQLDRSEFLECAQLSNGQTLKEFASNGRYFPVDCVELLEYITEQKAMREEEARHVFMEMLKLAGKLHAQSKYLGIVRPEDIMLFAGGKVKVLKTRIFSSTDGKEIPLIVPSYCPPEWSPKTFYQGTESVAWDVFVLGQLLTIMLLGEALFSQAKPVCKHFQLFCKDSETYLKKRFAKRIPSLYLEPDLLSLLLEMLHPSPDCRASLEQVLSNSWLLQGANRPIAFSKPRTQDTTAVLQPSINAKVQKQNRDQLRGRQTAQALQTLPVSRDAAGPPEFVPNEGLLQMNYSYFSATPSRICSELPRISEKLGGTLVEGKDPYSFIYEMGRQNHFKMLMKLYKTENCSVAQFHILDGSMFAFRDTVDQMKQELIEMYMDK